MMLYTLNVYSAVYINKKSRRAKQLDKYFYVLLLPKKAHDFEDGIELV